MYDEDFQRRSDAASRGGEREDRRPFDPGHQHRQTGDVRSEDLRLFGARRSRVGRAAAHKRRGVSWFAKEILERRRRRKKERILYKNKREKLEKKEEN